LASDSGDGACSPVDILFPNGHRFMDGRQSGAAMDALARSLGCRASGAGYDVMSLVD